MITKNIPPDIIKQLQVFDKFEFHENGHYYTYPENGVYKRIHASVTKVAGSLKNPFDANTISRFVAASRGVPQSVILAEWDYAREFSCVKGNAVHNRLERLWEGADDLPTYDKEAVLKQFGKDDLEDMWPKLEKMADSVYDKFKLRLIPAGLEFVVGCTECSVAGSIDFLGYAEKTQSLVILDYKTNKELEFEGYKGQMMRGELSHLPDSNYFIYSLQLEIYRSLIKRHTTLNVNPDKFLLWIHEKNDDVQIFKTANLEAEANLLLDKNMKLHNNEG